MEIGPGHPFYVDVPTEPDPLVEFETELIMKDIDPKHGRSTLNSLFRHYNEVVKEHDWQVVICTPVPYDCKAHFYYAPGLFFLYVPGRRILKSHASHDIDKARNCLVRKALEVEEATHIFFIDADMYISPFTLMRLIQRDKPVVSAISCMKYEPFVPIIVKRVVGGGNYWVELTEDRLDKLFRIDACGLACTLIKREVFDEFGPPWFVRLLIEKGFKCCGEDIYFFDQLQQLGIDVWIDTSVVAQHCIGLQLIPDQIQKGLIRLGPNAYKKISEWNKSALKDLEKGYKWSDGNVYGI